MDYKAIIRKCVREILAKKGDRLAFTDDTPLISSGRIDSLEVVEIVLFLEKEFGLRAGNSNVSQSELNSVNSIEAVVQEVAGTR